MFSPEVKEGFPADPLPDHGAPFLRAFAATQAFHQFVGSPELLVAADHLDAWSVLGIHEDRAGPHDLQQVAHVEHPPNELLLQVLELFRGEPGLTL